MQSNIPQLLISATSSGCGKTTFTLGLMRALKRRGMSLAGFKCGPDYIDPKFHHLASGRESINLDLYMMSSEHVKAVYAEYSQDAEASIVEGVMGLFDGSHKMQGSSADLAQLLDLPVILLVNAASSAYSTGATIYGYKNWKPNIRIAGVVFNRVASESHYSFLRDAAADAGVESFGYIPRTASLNVPSRHLGLSLEELAQLDYFPDQVADLIEAHIDVEKILELCTQPRPSHQATISSAHKSDSKSRRIAVAQDEAFNFIYPENIKALQDLGELVFFSPLEDETLPQGTDLLYLPGGYPEFYLDKLSRNETMRLAIKHYGESGGHILAECGGMMYLCEDIIDENQQAYPMCGLLPHQATMEDMKLSLGYRSVVCKDIQLRGHEFHYSRLKIKGEEHIIAEQYGAKGNKVSTALYRYKNVIAGYTHLYWAEKDIMRLWS